MNFQITMYGIKQDTCNDYIRHTVSNAIWKICFPCIFLSLLLHFKKDIKRCKYVMGEGKSSNYNFIYDSKFQPCLVLKRKTVILFAIWWYPKFLEISFTLFHFLTTVRVRFFKKISYQDPSKGSFAFLFVFSLFPPTSYLFLTKLSLVPFLN